MNYRQFSEKQNVIEKILNYLGVLSIENVVIEVDNNPDYDITAYEREISTNYFFHNSWDFTEKFKSIVDINVLKSSIFDSETFQRMSTDYGIPLEDNDCDFLIQVLNVDQDAFDNYGFGTENGEFRFHNLRLRTIDNSNGQVYYEGSFRGNNADIAPIDWGVYSLLNVTSITKSIDTLPFYNTLLAESYLLYFERKFKLAYFLVFSAFESFVNYELGTIDDPDRLRNKLNELFSNRFTDIGRHQIYTSVLNEYNQHTTNRNTIAHGRNEIIISQEEVKGLLLFVLTIISTYKSSSISFENLYNDIIN